MALGFSAFSTLNVTNSHRALSSFGVLSTFHVLSVIFPSGDPVARTPRREYSRSWKAREVIVGSTCGSVAEKLRSRLAMGRALIVCRHNFSREHVAMYPCRTRQYQWLNELKRKNYSTYGALINGNQMNSNGVALSVPDGSHIYGPV